MEVRHVQGAGAGSAAAVRIFGGRKAGSGEAGMGAWTDWCAGMSEVVGDAGEYRDGGTVFRLEGVGRGWLE